MFDGDSTKIKYEDLSILAMEVKKIDKRVKFTNNIKIVEDSSKGKIC